MTKSSGIPLIIVVYVLAIIFKIKTFEKFGQTVGAKASVSGCLVRLCQRKRERVYPHQAARARKAIA